MWFGDLTNYLSCFSDALKKYHNLSQELAAMIVWKISWSEGMYICAVISLIRCNMLSIKQEAIISLHGISLWQKACLTKYWWQLQFMILWFELVLGKLRMPDFLKKKCILSDYMMTTFSGRRRWNNGGNCPTCCL